jgi:hypothetical protein
LSCPERKVTSSYSIAPWAGPGYSSTDIHRTNSEYLTIDLLSWVAFLFCGMASMSNQIPRAKQNKERPRKKLYDPREEHSSLPRSTNIGGPKWFGVRVFILNFVLEHEGFLCNLILFVHNGNKF